MPALVGANLSHHCCSTVSSLKMRNMSVLVKPTYQAFRLLASWDQNNLTVDNRLANSVPSFFLCLFLKLPFEFSHPFFTGKKKKIRTRYQSAWHYNHQACKTKQYKRDDFNSNALSQIAENFFQSDHIKLWFWKSYLWLNACSDVRL